MHYNLHNLLVSGTINGSKETIKSGSKWIVTNSPGNEQRIAEILTTRVLSFGNQAFESKLHLAYLLNDVLSVFHKKREDKAQVDVFAAALGPHLLAIFDTIYRGSPNSSTQFLHLSNNVKLPRNTHYMETHSSVCVHSLHIGHRDEEKDKAVKLVRLWGKREIYPANVIEDLENKMKSEVPIAHYPSQIQASLPQPPAQPSVPTQAPGVVPAPPTAYPPQTPPAALHRPPSMAGASAYTQAVPYPQHPQPPSAPFSAPIPHSYPSPSPPFTPGAPPAHVHSHQAAPVRPAGPPSSTLHLGRVIPRAFIFLCISVVCAT